MNMKSNIFLVVPLFFLNLYAMEQETPAEKGLQKYQQSNEPIERNEKSFRVDDSKISQGSENTRQWLEREASEEFDVQKELFIYIQCVRMMDPDLVLPSGRFNKKYFKKLIALKKEEESNQYMANNLGAFSSKE